MLQFDILGLIPQSLKRQALDTLVDFVSEQARKYASEEIAARIKKLRSDAAFNQAFEEGLRRAVRRFVQEYEVEDEDLVAAIAADEGFFKNEEVRAALLTILKKPGVYLAGERERLAESFDSVLPRRKNRERVDRAVIYLLKCLAEEVWHLPELQPIYSLQFQRMTAEATRQQVELQKAQLQALTSLNAGVREALLQLTDAIAERKLLLPGEAPALPAPPSKPQVYHNLPQPDYGRFVGREQELAQVARILRPYPHSQHALVTIDGIGGIGKSALALEVAHRYLRNYERIPPEERFEAIIWTSAKQSVLTTEGIQPRSQALRTMDDIYTTIAVTLQREDITRARPEEQAEVMCNALTRQRTLLVVDNLETVDDEAVMNFLRELPAPTKAIVTTRHRIDVAYPVRLVGMPWEDARKLIAQECDKKGVTLSKDEARRLYDRTGGVPLAIVWSVAQMGFGYGVETVLARLGRPIGDIARFCFERAVERIRGKPAYKLLIALSLFATDASREALGYVADLPKLDRDEALVELERLSLVVKQENRFCILPLTKDYALDILKSDMFDIKLRAANYLLEFAKRCCGKEYRGDLYERFSDLDAEYTNILDILDWCYFNRKWQHVLDFVHALTGGYYASYLISRGYWDTQILWIDRAIRVYYELTEEAQKENRWKLVMLLNSGCWTHVLRGEQDTAVRQAELALELSYTSNDLQGHASALRQSGYVQQSIGNLEEAKRRYQKALEIFTSIGDKRSASALLSVIGELLLKQGDIGGAESFLLDSITSLRSLEDQARLGHALQRYGEFLLAVNRLEEAARYLQEGIQVAIVTRNQRVESQCRFAIAKVLAKQHEFAKARQFLMEAYDGLTRMGIKSAKEAESLLSSLPAFDTKVDPLASQE